MTTRSYRYLTKKWQWSGPIEAESARQALSTMLALPPGEFDRDLPLRIIKVEGSGELIEFNRGTDGQWR